MIQSVAELRFLMIHPDISRPIGQGDNRKAGTREIWAPLYKEHIFNLKRLPTDEDSKNIISVRITANRFIMRRK